MQSLEYFSKNFCKTPDQSPLKVEIVVSNKEYEDTRIDEASLTINRSDTVEILANKVSALLNTDPNELYFYCTLNNGETVTMAHDIVLSQPGTSFEFNRAIDTKQTEAIDLERYTSDNEFKRKVSIVNGNTTHVSEFDTNEFHCVTKRFFEKFKSEEIKKNKYVLAAVFPEIHQKFATERLQNIDTVNQELRSYTQDPSLNIKKCYISEIIIDVQTNENGNVILDQIFVQANKLLSDEVPFCRLGNKVVVFKKSNVKDLPVYNEWIKIANSGELVFKVKNYNSKYATLTIHRSKKTLLKVDWDDAAAINTFSQVKEVTKKVVAFLKKLSAITRQPGLEPSENFKINLINSFMTFENTSFKANEFANFLVPKFSDFLAVSDQEDGKTRLRFINVNLFSLTSSIKKLLKRQTTLRSAADRATYVRKTFPYAPEDIMKTLSLNNETYAFMQQRFNNGIDVKISEISGGHRIQLLGCNFYNLPVISEFLTFLINSFLSKQDVQQAVEVDDDQFDDDDDDDFDLVPTTAATVDEEVNLTKVPVKKYTGKKNRFLAILEELDPVTYSGDYSRKCQNQRTPMILEPNVFKELQKKVTNEVKSLKTRLKSATNADEKTLISRRLKEFLIHELVVSQGATEYKGFYYFCPLTWNFNANVAEDNAEDIFPLYETAVEHDNKNELHYIEDKNLKGQLDNVDPDKDTSLSAVHTWYASFLVNLKKKKLLPDDDHTSGPTCPACCFFGDKKRAREGRSVCSNTGTLKENTTVTSNYIVSDAKELTSKQFGFLPAELNRILNHSKKVPPEPRVAGNLDYYLRFGTGSTNLLEAVTQAVNDNGNAIELARAAIDKMPLDVLKSTKLYADIVSRKNKKIILLEPNSVVTVKNGTYNYVLVKVKQNSERVVLSLLDDDDVNYHVKLVADALGEVVVESTGKATVDTKQVRLTQIEKSDNVEVIPFFQTVRDIIA